MKRNRHKRKSTFTVMVIANRADGKAHRFRMSHIMIPIVACSLVCVVIACTAYTMSYPYIHSKISEYEYTSNIDPDEFNQLKDENMKLSAANEDLQEQVSVLSLAVNSKNERLEAFEAENSVKSTPTGYPLDCTASIDYYGIVEQTGEQQEEEAPDQEEQLENDELTEALASAEQEIIVVFSASSGTAVIASGNGTIRAVTEDPEYGYRVEIDHGNGYVSIYRNKTEPKVKEGAEIARGTIIFELSDNQKVGYQILFDGVYMDPMDIMEIYG